MATVSDITVASLTATPTLRGNKLAWTYSDPRSGALPNIALDMVEVWASTTNDRTTAAKVGEGITDFLHTGLVEEQTWYYWIKARDYLPAAQGGPGYGAWHPSGSTAGVTATAIGVSGLYFGMANAKINATVSSNALTVALKTAAGNDASASDPIFISFPTSSGAYQVRTITAALSLVVPSGATLGVYSTDPFRIQVVIFDDAGTLRIGVRNSSEAPVGGIYPMADSAIASSTAMSSPGSSSVDTFYTGTAVTSKYYRRIGILDYSSGLATAGTYNVAPDVIRLAGPSLALPGETVKSYSNNMTGSATYTTTIPWDGTKPQNNEGSEILDLAFTPLSPCNFYKVQLLLHVAANAAVDVILAMFKDSGADAIAASAIYLPTADHPFQIKLVFIVQAGTSSQRNYKFRWGPSSAATLTRNGSGGSQKLNGVLISHVQVDELAG